MEEQWKVGGIEWNLAPVDGLVLNPLRPMRKINAKPWRDANQAL